MKNTVGLFLSNIPNLIDFDNRRSDESNNTISAEVSAVMQKVGSEASTVLSVNEVAGNRLYVRGKIFGEDKGISSLVDSGATVDSISIQLLKDLKLYSRLVPLEKVAYAKSFGGTRHKIYGIIDLTLQLGKQGYTAPFVVFNNLASYQVILGVPFHNRFGLMRDAKTKLEQVLGQDAVCQETKNG